MIELILLSLLLSAFFSSAETALVSAEKIRIQVWMKQKVRGAARLFSLLGNPEQYLTIVLVGNNIAVVCASSLMAVYLSQWFSGAVITGISTLFLLVFGEILPKSIARQRPDRYSLFAAPLIRFFNIAFYPVVLFVKWISTILLKLGGTETRRVRTFFSKEDIHMLVKEGQRLGIVESRERDMLSKMLIRSSLSVSEVMVHRTEMVCVNKTDPVETVLDICEETGLSRLPVLEEDIDHICGIIYSKDLILNNPRNLAEVMREPLFVPETAGMLRLFHTMRRQGTSIAVVVDEYGGTAGLLTTEDMIEEFFGEIMDEHDDVYHMFRKITDIQIDVMARAEVRELNSRFDMNLPLGDYHTIGGLIIDYLGYIPRRGETFALNNVTFTILSTYENKINWVRITRKRQEPRE